MKIRKKSPKAMDFGDFEDLAKSDHPLPYPAAVTEGAAKPIEDHSKT
jgi:hypothetical protein